MANEICIENDNNNVILSARNDLNWRNKWNDNIQ